MYPDQTAVLTADVRTVGTVDLDALSLGDVADDVVPVYRHAAARDGDLHVVNAFNLKSGPAGRFRARLHVEQTGKVKAFQS